MAVSLEDIKARVQHLVDRMNNLIADDQTIDIDICVSRAIADAQVDISSLDPDSKLFLALEIRVMYYVVYEARFTIMLDFRIDTGNEGREIDKTKRLDNLKKTMDDLDRQYKVAINAARSVSGIVSLSGRDTVDLGDISTG